MQGRAGFSRPGVSVGRTWDRVREPGARGKMMSWRILVLIGAASCVGTVSAASDPSVKPVGTYPFVLPGLSVSPDAKPKALLWCQGVNLMGVVVPDEKSSECGTPSQKRSAPRAFLLRDGRCETAGSTVSFGFLVSRKAWLFEAAGGAPEERTVWLLHRFEGSLKAGQLRGVLVQVDVNHPGYSFQRKSVEVEALPAEQASFADDSAWRSGIAQAFCLAADDP